jgi:hypothetical protein
MQTSKSMMSKFLFLNSRHTLRAALLTTCVLLLLVWAERSSTVPVSAGEQAFYPEPGGTVEADPALLPDWYYEGDQKGAQFGYSVSTAGDVNGDGYDDVVVGAPVYNNGTENEGAVFVFYGTQFEGLQSFPAVTLSGNQKGARFGCSVGAAGDVNGDQYDDVIVGACDYNNGLSKEGRAFLFYGSNAGLGTTPGWTFDGGQKDAHLGFSVGSAGNVNGDAFDDIIIGAPQSSNGEMREGQAYVFRGSASGPITSTYWILEGNQAGALFGTSVATAGDANCDGYSDVIVGAPRFSDSQSAEGAIFLFYGSDVGLDVTPGWWVSSGQSESGFGTAVGTAGDINGDGCSDVIVGAPQYDNEQTEPDVGAAFVYHGAESGPGSGANWMAYSDYSLSGFGVSVGTAGDVNGDGYDDVIVGAHHYDYPGGEREEGAAFVYHGAEMGLHATAGRIFEGNKADTEFGYSVSTAGDANRDGFSDVIVGAPEYKHFTDPFGRAFGYFGPISEPDFYLLYLPLIVRVFP